MREVGELTNPQAIYNIALFWLEFLMFNFFISVLKNFFSGDFSEFFLFGIGGFVKKVWVIRPTWGTVGFQDFSMLAKCLQQCCGSR